MNCEDFLIQKLALLDGDRATLPDEQIAAHFSGCADCRRQLGDWQKTFDALGRQQRRVVEADLRPAVEGRINAESAARPTFKWLPFALLGVFFVVYKLLEMIPERDFGPAFKFVPLILAAVLFAVIKENPFKINTELILEK